MSKHSPLLFWRKIKHPVSFLFFLKSEDGGAEALPPLEGDIHLCRSFTMTSWSHQPFQAPKLNWRARISFITSSPAKRLTYHPTAQTYDRLSACEWQNEDYQCELPKRPDCYLIVLMIKPLSNIKMIKCLQDTHIWTAKSLANIPQKGLFIQRV